LATVLWTKYQAIATTAASAAAWSAIRLYFNG
jgi:hypothetical protein